MSSLTNTAIPVQDTITDLASYRRLVDSLVDVDYTGSGVALERRRLGVTRATDEMVLTIDGEALVAYRAVAAQAAEEANQIRLDADLAAQGEAMWIMQEVANDGHCAMFMEPTQDQPDLVEQQQGWNTSDDQGDDGWGMARDSWGGVPGPDPWAPAPAPTLGSISADVNHTLGGVRRLETEVGIIRNELRYARVSAL